MPAMLAVGSGLRLGSPCPGLAKSLSPAGDRAVRGMHRAGVCAPAGRRPGVSVHAAKRDEGVTAKKVKDGGGFRFDAFKNAWVRDNRIMTASEAGEEFNPTIQPKSGAAYTVWPVVYTELVDRGLKSISPEDALKRQRKGAVIVDVRLAKDFAKEHAAGAVSVPLYRVTEGKEMWDNIKRVAFMGLNMTPTERDPDFAAKVEAAVGKRKEVIVMCSLGGSMSRTVSGSTMGRSADKVKKFEDPERSFGRESRSLKACYELYQAGFNNITHMEGGLPAWRVADLGTEP